MKKYRFRLYGVPKHIRRDLHTIAYNSGVRQCQILNNVLNDAAQELKNPPDFGRSEKTSLEISNVDPETDKILRTAAAAHGITLGQLLTPYFAKFVNANPQLCRRFEPLDD